MLLTLDDIQSPQLGNRRPLTIWIPDDSQGLTNPRRTYPVIYMQDGQNLFDPETSFAGDWAVSETMRTLAREGREAMIVGVHNMGVERIAEYSPFPDRRHGGGRGEAYLAFLIETVKPLIDDRFPTRPQAASTGLFGSSLGGLISLYGFLRYPETFGFCGAMSPSLWFGQGQIFHLDGVTPRGRVYLDAGTRERRGDWRDRYLFGFGSWRYVADLRRMSRWLRRRGCPDEDIRVVIEAGGLHSEASWRRRLPDALRFLLPVSGEETARLSPQEVG